MGTTSIEWTEATWNPTTGCDKVSPGCAHCYAEDVAVRFWAAQYPPIPIAIGQDGEVSASRPRAFTDVQCHEDRLDQPLRWKRPRRIFVNSMSDLFHEDVPDAFIDRVFAVMALAPRHTFQILTKRAERMRDYLLTLTGSVERMDDLGADALGMAECMESDALDVRAAHVGEVWPLPNVWLGVSVENQHFADARIPLLLQTPAAVRFLSLEPLLERVDLTNYLWTIPGARLNGLHWLIVGGESGLGARPFDVAWARWTVAQGASAGVPVFVKQLGANAIDGKLTAKELVEGGAGRPRPVDYPLTEATAAELLDGYGVGVVNRRVTLRDRKGGDMAEWPEDLRVREFPAGRA